jgi:hypothetical protein
LTTRDPTSSIARVDILVGQVRDFLDLDLLGEAIARARHALAQCDKELAQPQDESTREDLRTRRVFVVELLERLGVDPLPSRQEHGTI